MVVVSIQPSALWQTRGMGGVRDGREVQEGGEPMYACGWLMFMYDRNWQNVVKQLPSNIFFLNFNTDKIQTQ